MLNKTLLTATALLFVGSVAYAQMSQNGQTNPTNQGTMGQTTQGQATQGQTTQGQTTQGQTTQDQMNRSNSSTQGTQMGQTEQDRMNSNASTNARTNAQTGYGTDTDTRMAGRNPDMDSQTRTTTTRRNYRAGERG